MRSPNATAAPVNAARGRVIAVGTTVVRAREGAAAATGEVPPGPGVTDLVITPGHRRRVVDGLVTGIHAPGESHHRLLGAFCRAEVLAHAWSSARRPGYRNHQFGDLCLFLAPIARLHGRRAA